MRRSSPSSRCGRDSACAEPARQAGRAGPAGPACGPAVALQAMDDLTPRLRAVCDLDIADVREFSGRHEYDGKIQDLSRDGVRAGLARLAGAAGARPGLGAPQHQAAVGLVARAAPLLDDPHDEAQLAVFERAARTWLGEQEMHRRNPLVHLAGLDLACYDREYAPQRQRDEARAAHLAGWPAAIESAIETLDSVSAPVAAALVDGIRGLAAGIPANADAEVRRTALAAHARLVAHIERAATHGDPDAALGSAA